MALHQVCHIEWDVTDLGAAQKFFGSLFNWSFREFGDSMVVFASGDNHIGGFMKKEHVEAAMSPSVWIEVEAIEPYLAKALAAGGTVVSEKTPVPGVGWSAQLGDPDGNVVGIVHFEK